jgi:protein AaeX
VLREINLFGGLAPSLLLYFLSAIGIFLLLDRGVVSPLGFYRLVWHPPLVRLALFVCLFAALVLLTRP